MPWLDVEKVGNVELSRLPARFSASRNQNLSIFFEVSNFRQISTWKIWFRPVFSGKNGQNWPNLEKDNFKIANFLV
jgi:hypothetical protein